jgi:hypothetical protein
MQETLRGGAPVTYRRIAWLSALIAVSWLLTAEAVLLVFGLTSRMGPVGTAVRSALSGLGSVLSLLTGVDPVNPASTPVATLFLLAVAAAFALTGWNIARFHETRTTEQADV